VPCSEEWDDLVCFYTILYNGINFKIVYYCKNKVDEIDTIENNTNTVTVRSWHKIKLKINYSLFKKQLLITKENFKNSLAINLLVNGFLFPPHKVFF